MFRADEDPLEALKAMRARQSGAGDDPLDALRKMHGPSEAEREIARTGGVSEVSARDPERRRTFGESAGAAASALLNSATLGASGLIDDALSSGTFAGNRAFRRQETESLPPAVRLAAEIGGAVASPIGSVGTAAKALKAAKTLQEARGAAKLLKIGGTLVPQAAKGAKLGERILRVAGDAAAQAGIAGTVNNLDEVSGEGAKNALVEGAKSAAMGAGVGGTLGSIAGVGARLASRTRNLPKLDKTAFKIKDEMAALDAANYGTAAGEATTTPPIREIIGHKVVAPYADKVRAVAEAEGRTINDAEVLMEAYKMMSRAVRATDKSIEGTAEFLADKEATKRIVNALKGRMLNAAEAPTAITTPGRARMLPERYSGPPAQGVPDTPFAATPLLDRRVETRAPSYSTLGPGIPSLRNAVNAHRTKAGELDKFVEGSNIGKSVGSGKSLTGEKLLVNSQEAFLRKVPDMTPQEAEAALAGIMGRTGESIHMTATPLGKFGLVSSMFRLPAQLYRTGPIVRALEAKLGQGNLGQPASDITRGTLARLFGARQGNNR